MIVDDEKNDIYFDKFNKHIPRILQRQIISKLANQYVFDAEGNRNVKKKITDIDIAASNSINRFHGTVLFVDISGFTVLSQRLKVDELRNQINAYFKKILDIAHKYDGDVIKFAGDALYILWQTKMNGKGRDFSADCKEGVEKATACGLEINSSCSNYPILLEKADASNADETSTFLHSLNITNILPQNGTKASPLNMNSSTNQLSQKMDKLTYLNVHAGIGVGIMAGVDVGANDRWEYLLVGDPISEVAVAEGDAEKGDLVISPTAHALFHPDATYVPRFSLGSSDLDVMEGGEGLMMLSCGCEETAHHHFKVHSDFKELSCYKDFGVKSPKEVVGINAGSSLMEVIGAAKELTPRGDKEEESSDEGTEDEDELALLYNDILAAFKAVQPSIGSRYTSRLLEGKEETKQEPKGAKGRWGMMERFAIMRHNEKEMFLSHFFNWLQQCLLDDIAKHVHEVVRLDYSFHCERRVDELGVFLRSEMCGETLLAHQSRFQQQQQQQTLRKSSHQSMRESRRQSAARNGTSFVSALRQSTRTKNRRRHERILQEDANLDSELRNVIVLFISVKMKNTQLYIDKGLNAAEGGPSTLISPKKSLELDGWEKEHTSKVESFHFLPRTKSEIAADESLMRRFQKCMEILTAAFRREGGHLRQFIVDDKGTVAIGTFGLRGAVNYDNASAAIDAAEAIMNQLQAAGMDASIGITSGKAYCGLVGSPLRHEYAVMGASTNLSARLMGKAQRGEIICDSELRNHDRKHVFLQLQAVQAKGYVQPVPTFKPVFNNNQISMNGSFSHSSDPTGEDRPAKTLSVSLVPFGLENEHAPPTPNKVSTPSPTPAAPACMEELPVVGREKIIVQVCKSLLSAPTQELASPDPMTGITTVVEEDYNTIERSGSLEFNGSIRTEKVYSPNQWFFIFARMLELQQKPDPRTMFVSSKRKAGSIIFTQGTALAAERALRAVASSPTIPRVTDLVPQKTTDLYDSAETMNITPDNEENQGAETPIHGIIKSPGSSPKTKKKVIFSDQSVTEKPEERLLFDITKNSKHTVLIGPHGIGKSALLKFFVTKISLLVKKEPSFNLAVFQHRVGIISTSKPFSGWQCLFTQILADLAAVWVSRQPAGSIPEREKRRKKQHPLVGLEYALTEVPLEFKDMKPLLGCLGIIPSTTPDTETTRNLSMDEKIDCTIDFLCAILQAYTNLTKKWVILVMDDLHNMDFVSLDLLYQVWSFNSGVTILSSYRPGNQISGHRAMKASMNNGRQGRTSQDSNRTNYSSNRSGSTVSTTESTNLAIANSSVTRHGLTSPMGSSEHSSSPDNGGYLNLFGSSPFFTKIKIPTLGLEATKSLALSVMSSFGISSELDNRIFNQIYEVTKGNPLYAYEVSHSAGQKFSVTDSAMVMNSMMRTEHLISDVVEKFRSHRIEEVVYYRFDQLDSESQLVLKMASVVSSNGQPFNLAMLQFMAESRSAEEDEEEIELPTSPTAEIDVAKVLNKILATREFIKVVNVLKPTRRSSFTAFGYVMPEFLTESSTDLSLDDEFEDMDVFVREISTEAVKNLSFGFQVEIEQRAIYDLMLDDQKESLHDRMAAFLELEHQQRIIEGGKAEDRTPQEWFEEGFHWEHSAAWAPAMICYYHSGMLLDAQGARSDCQKHLVAAYRMLDRLRRDAGFVHNDVFTNASFGTLFTNLENKEQAIEPKKAGQDGGYKFMLRNQSVRRRKSVAATSMADLQKALDVNASNTRGSANLAQHVIEIRLSGNGSGDLADMMGGNSPALKPERRKSIVPERRNSLLRLRTSPLRVPSTDNSPVDSPPKDTSPNGTSVKKVITELGEVKENDTKQLHVEINELVNTTVTFDVTPTFSSAKEDGNILSSNSNGPLTRTDLFRIFEGDPNLLETGLQVMLRLGQNLLTSGGQYSAFVSKLYEQAMEILLAVAATDDLLAKATGSTAFAATVSEEKVDGSFKLCHITICFPILSGISMLYLSGMLEDDSRYSRLRSLDSLFMDLAETTAEYKVHLLQGLFLRRKVLSLTVGPCPDYATEVMERIKNEYVYEEHTAELIYTYGSDRFANALAFHTQLLLMQGNLVKMKEYSELLEQVLPKYKHLHSLAMGVIPHLHGLMLFGNKKKVALDILLKFQERERAELSNSQFKTLNPICIEWIKRQVKFDKFLEDGDASIFRSESRIIEKQIMSERFLYAEDAGGRPLLYSVYNLLGLGVEYICGSLCLLKAIVIERTSTESADKKRALILKYLQVALDYTEYLLKINYGKVFYTFSYLSALLLKGQILIKIANQHVGNSEVYESFVSNGRRSLEECGKFCTENNFYGMLVQISVCLSYYPNAKDEARRLREVNFAKLLEINALVDDKEKLRKKLEHNYGRISPAGVAAHVEDE